MLGTEMADNLPAKGGRPLAPGRAGGGVGERGLRSGPHEHHGWVTNRTPGYNTGKSGKRILMCSLHSEKQQKENHV